MTRRVLGALLAALALCSPQPPPEDPWPTWPPGPDEFDLRHCCSAEDVHKAAERFFGCLYDEIEGLRCYVAGVTSHYTEAIRWARTAQPGAPNVLQDVPVASLADLEAVLGNFNAWLLEIGRRATRFIAEVVARFSVWGEFSAAVAAAREAHRAAMAFVEEEMRNNAETLETRRVLAACGWGDSTMWEALVLIHLEPPWAAGS